MHFGSLSQDARAGNQAKCGHIFSHFECLQVIFVVLLFPFYLFNKIEDVVLQGFFYMNIACFEPVSFG